MVFENVFDIILLLVSGAACFYCWMLNRKLKNLQDVKKGLGSSIVSLSNAISQTSVSAQEAKLSAMKSVEELNTLLEQVDNCGPKVDSLLHSINRSKSRSVNAIQEAQKDASDNIKPLLIEAQEKAETLSVLIAKLDQLSAVVSTQTKNSSVAPLNEAGPSNQARRNPFDILEEKAS